MKGLAARILAPAGCTIMLLAGCTTAVQDVEVPDGFSVGLVAGGFDGPTQIALAPNDRLLVAQLAGGENDRAGQIVSVSMADPSDRTVLFDGLDKPTGVAVLEDDVWVMQRRSLWRGPLGGGSLEPVLENLPFNGRSQGTLTATADGRVLFDTSGALSDGMVVEGSGTLWSIGTDGTPQEVATGFKHAYAHVVGPDGVLWTTEVSDGTFDGEPAADEVLEVRPGVDHGWPKCVGDNRPVAEFGATGSACTGVPSSLAVFDPGATPTSVAIAPWDPDTLLVALWNRDVVVSIDTTVLAPVEPQVFATGIDRPQHLLVHGDRLLVVEHAKGRILSVAR